MSFDVNKAEVEIVENVTSNEVAVVENNAGEILPDCSILNPELPMRTKIDIATEVAGCLKDLIIKQNLSVKLNKSDEEYVLVEGWEVLGTMLGISPVTEIISEITNNQGRVVGYVARATLYRNPIIQNGEIVGGDLISRTEASADKSGFQKDLPSIRSMAQTRALGKCYRMALSWVMKLAGYQGTPAEEMKSFRGE